jgi:hypothetical protein
MTSKHSIHKYLLEHKDEIIEQYKNRVRVMDIAQRHNVSSTTITQIMRKWGIPRRGSKDKSVIVKKYNISPKLLAQREVNSRINKLRVKYYPYPKVAFTIRYRGEKVG